MHSDGIFRRVGIAVFEAGAIGVDALTTRHEHWLVGTSGTSAHSAQTIVNQH